MKAKMLINALMLLKLNFRHSTNALYIIYRLISHISVIRLCKRENIRAMIKPSPLPMPARSLRASKAARFRALRGAVLPWRPGSRAHVKRISAIDESACTSLTPLMRSFARRWFEIAPISRFEARAREQNPTVNCQLSNTDKAINDKCWIKLVSPHTHTQYYL